jgi:hypothetical protein
MERPRLKENTWGWWLVSLVWMRGGKSRVWRGGRQRENKYLVLWLVEAGRYGSCIDASSGGDGLLADYPIPILSSTHGRVVGK